MAGLRAAAGRPAPGAERAALDDRAARRAPGGRTRPGRRPAAAHRHGGDHGARPRTGRRADLRRADNEFHSLLIQVAGNRMLEHLSGIVSAALQVSGGPVTGCERPTDTSLAHHARIVDALAAGDGVAAEEAMRQLLTVHPEVERVVPAPRPH
ncbi:FCD domain-containing protein [Streptomyces pseudogriseolus]|uniref:FCD domain-containing protein n=1 Tax=Streptomyces pseudogriseolus TaxID=36817 RepID=UPI003FA1AFB6